MRSNLTQPMLTAIHAQETNEVVLPLVTLTHADWPETIRLVADWKAITHRGSEFQPLAFEVALPDEEAEGVPVINWAVDNVDRRLVESLRQVKGAVQASVIWVLASDPDTIQVGPLDAEMRAVQYDARTIRGTLGIEPVLDAQFGSMIMNPKNAPALF